MVSARLIGQFVLILWGETSGKINFHSQPVGTLQKLATSIQWASGGRMHAHLEARMRAFVGRGEEISQQAWGHHLQGGRKPVRGEELCG